ncbi:hypothetical protein ACP70R_046166 [Stipagrostis hirtigluma subsp. patula]
MRVWMLGRNAPTSRIGIALKELYVAKNSAGGLLNPSKLLSRIRSMHPKLEGDQDSHELLCYLRNDLQDPTVIDSIFGGELFVTKSCRFCLSEQVRDDVYILGFIIAIGIKGFHPNVDYTDDEPLLQSSERNYHLSVEDCLQVHFEETVAEEECMKCPKISKDYRKHALTQMAAHQVKNNQNGGFTQKTYIRKLPRVLTVHLQRYTKNLRKVTEHVSFSEILDLGDFMDPSVEG